MKGNADNRFFNNNPMNMSFYRINEKKLPSALHSDSMIFKLINVQSNQNKFSLYNYAHNRFVKTGKNDKNENIITGSILNYDQDSATINEQWEIVYNLDYTVSFKSLQTSGFLSVSDQFNVVLKQLTKPDDTCKWDVLTIDSIMIGKSESLSNNDNGFTVSIPKYIHRVGTYPVNQQAIPSNNSETLWGDIIVTHNLKNVDENYNNFTATRIDSPTYTKDQSWEQNVYVAGINKDYLLHMDPLFQIEVEGDCKEFIIYNDIIVALSKKDNTNAYFRYLNSTSRYITSWMQFTYKGEFLGLTIGKVDNKMAVMAMEYIESGTPILKYRYFDNFVDATGWVNTNLNNLKQIQYNFSKNKLYGLKSDNNLYELDISSPQNAKNLNLNLLYFKFGYLRTGIDSLYGINEDNYLIHATITTSGTVDSTTILDNKIRIKKFDIYNNIVFAIGIDGRLYYKYIIGYQGFTPYTLKQAASIVDIYIYNDLLYALNNSGLLLSCPIII